MPATRSPMEVVANSQYDLDSAPNGPFNCGPTSVTNALQFHQDRDYPINETRRLGEPVDRKGTSTSQRKLMFDKRGTPSSVLHLSPAEVKALLNGKRSFEIALLMEKIPLSVRIRPFPGSHSVNAIANGIVGGQTGIYVLNPDFHTARGEASRYFYPDRYWIPAYNALGGWCVVPDKDKVIPTRYGYRRACHSKAGLNLRTGPGRNYSKVKVVPAGFGFTSIQIETKGGAYAVGTATRRDWLSFNYRGRLVWVARGFVKEG